MYYLIKVESFTLSSWYIMSDDDPKIKKFFEEYYKSDSIETKLGWLEVGGIKRLVKKSENLFDLIEIGDLIEQTEMDTKELVDKEYWVEQVIEKSEEGLHTFNWILKSNDCIKTIYKKTQNGDFLKVWERGVIL